VIPTNPRAEAYLTGLFQERRVAKTYLCLVGGEVPAGRGELTARLHVIDNPSTYKVALHHDSLLPYMDI